MHKLPEFYITKTISFLQKIKPDGKKMLIHHGDQDGCTAAALLSLGIKEKFGWDWDKVYWVGSDEFDFIDMKKRILEINPDYIVFLDLNIAAEKKDVLKDIIKETGAKILIFDHHISPDLKLKDTIYLNPTSTSELNKKSPVPACIFAHNVYRFLGKKNISWITGAGIIGEGMTKHYKFFFPKVSIKFPNLLGKDIFKSKLAEISSLIYANFISRIKENIAFDLLIMAGEQEDPEMFFGKTSEARRLFNFSKTINTEVSLFFENFEKNIKHISELNLFVGKVESKYKIDGLISDILKEKYQDKVIILHSLYKDKVLIELKTSRDDVDFVAILKKVCKKANCISAGGHSMAAGAMLSRKDLDLFLEEFENELPSYLGA